MEPINWRKSTRSADNGACVEVAFVEDVALLRDSKYPDDVWLEFDRAVWVGFVDDVKAGRFDG